MTKKQRKKEKKKKMKEKKKKKFTKYLFDNEVEALSAAIKKNKSVNLIYLYERHIPEFAAVIVCLGKLKHFGN